MAHKLSDRTPPAHGGSLLEIIAGDHLTFVISRPKNARRLGEGAPPEDASPARPADPCARLEETSATAALLGPRLISPGLAFPVKKNAAEKRPLWPAGHKARAFFADAN